MDMRPPPEMDPEKRAGNAGSKLLESNVDLVVFGHEQDGKIAGGGKPWELSNQQWLGNKKRIGEMDANNSEIDMVVFNHEVDDFSTIKEVSAVLCHAIPPPPPPPPLSPPPHTFPKPIPGFAAPVPAPVLAPAPASADAATRLADSSRPRWLS